MMPKKITYYACGFCDSEYEALDGCVEHETVCMDNPENKNQYDPDYTVHPGDHIVELLRTLGRDYWKIPVNIRGVFMNIIAGVTPIRESEAELLEYWVRYPFEMWLTLQKNHDEWIEKNG